MSLAGNFKEVVFADLLEFYCLSRQTAAVSVTGADKAGGEPIGTFFVEGGAVVDARFDGREGAEAVRNAMRRLHQGAFQVQLGARSERRTVHEPWRALVLEEVRPPGIMGGASPLRSTKSPRVPTPVARPTVGGTGGPVVAHANASPMGLVVPVRQELLTGTRAFLAQLTEPLPRIGREFLPGPGARWVLAFGAAVLVGGALAVVVGQMLEGSAAPNPQQGDAEASRRTLARRAPAGVTDTEVTFGMTAPLSGPAKEIGRQMKVGLETAFAVANSEGGVHGRSIRLLAVDDGYEPERTREVMRQLTEGARVFGFVGNVGTPIATTALPDALERRLLLFGALSGAASLRRDPPDRTVFNYRASSLEETAALVRYLVEVRRLQPDQIAVFAEEDAYGDAGYQGVVQALLRYPNARPVLKVTYKRNTSDVATAVKKVLERRDGVRAVVMVATYRAAARFIERVWAQRPKMTFASVSAVGSQALAEELMPLGPRFTGGVIISQVVPLPTSHSSAVLRYQDALARYAPGEKPDFGSLEGYVVGNLLLEGLRRSGRTVTTENVVRALETIENFDLGLGAQMTFDPGEHQGSHRVWGTVLDARGSYRALEFD
ncbi:MAG: ABC transporter substrate-binding protein [Myxococcaceae bacterium]